MSASRSAIDRSHSPIASAVLSASTSCSVVIGVPISALASHIAPPAAMMWPSKLSLLPARIASANACCCLKDAPAMYDMPTVTPRFRVAWNHPAGM